MNVLILTPDAVGSTLLQRLITIYMQFHNYDRPVINLHELTNGLVRYHNPTFNQDVLGKKDGAWGYHQSLEEIVALLSSVDHYKTSRLAHYHIRNRQDTIEDQISFYQYLNDNFYIISCRRHNVFEHALSWCLSKITKKLNVYSGDEKINSFFSLYRDGLYIDPNSLIQTLNAYRDYLAWCNNHFNVASYFYYDEHLSNIEQYILSLPIFSQQHKQLTWKDRYGLNFTEWNQCHHVTSDLGSLALDNPTEFLRLANTSEIFKIPLDVEQFLENYKNVADPQWPVINSLEDYEKLPESIRTEVEQQHHLTVPTQSKELISHVQLSANIVDLLPAERKNLLDQYQQQYQLAKADIKEMVDSGIIVSLPPIKKQTLAEKKHMIRNYSKLLDVYNQWIKLNPEIGNPLDLETLNRFAQNERMQWTAGTRVDQLSVEQNTD